VSAVPENLGAVRLDGRVDTGQFAAGIHQALNAQWNITGTMGYAFENQRDIEQSPLHFPVGDGHVAARDRDIAFNPLGEDAPNNPLSAAAIRAEGRATYHSAFTYANLSGTGPLFFLPTGPVRLTLGSEYRVQTFVTSITAPDLASAPETDRDRTAIAAFAYSSLPLLGSDTPKERPLKLELSVGLRFERYSDAGSGWSPLLGVAFSPHLDWTVQGTWVQLFRPPNLPDLNESSNTSQLMMLPDPKASTGYASALVWSGSNRHLRPETATSVNLGVTFTPRGLAGVSSALTYFHTKISSQIQDSPGLLLAALTDSRYQDWVTREVSGPVRDQICADSHFNGVLEDCRSTPVEAIVDDRLHNAASLVTDGLEWANRYALNAPLGRLMFSVDGTYVLRYAQADTPASSSVERRNTAHNPVALRLRGSLGWERGSTWASVASNYQGQYNDTDIVPKQRINAWMTWDLVLGYRIMAPKPVAVDEVQIVLSAQNIFNQHPPYLINPVEGVGYDEENGDLLGRRVSLALQIRW
jgi:iron complex outermembrane receptor protein